MIKFLSLIWVKKISNKKDIVVAIKWSRFCWVLTQCYPFPILDQLIRYSIACASALHSKLNKGINETSKLKLRSHTYQGFTYYLHLRLLVAESETKVNFPFWRQTNYSRDRNEAWWSDDRKRCHVEIESDIHRAIEHAMQCCGRFSISFLLFT